MGFQEGPALVPDNHTAENVGSQRNIYGAGNSVIEISKWQSCKMSLFRSNGMEHDGMSDVTLESTCTMVSTGKLVPPYDDDTEVYSPVVKLHRSTTYPTYVGSMMVEW